MRFGPRKYSPVWAVSGKGSAGQGKDLEVKGGMVCPLNSKPPSTCLFGAQVSVGATLHEKVLWAGVHEGDWLGQASLVGVCPCLEN